MISIPAAAGRQTRATAAEAANYRPRPPKR